MPTLTEFMALIAVAVSFGWAMWVSSVLAGRDSEIFCLTLRLSRAEQELKVLVEDYKHQYRMNDAEWEEDVNDSGTD